MYVHGTNCISPQQTFANSDLDRINPSVNNLLFAVEPAYPQIPLQVLRRMGKAVRIGVGAALPLFENELSVDGIIIGTANGGMEDCIKFLNQIVQYEEGRLTPTNFVQSTPNAIASQIALITQNHGYNITHVHRGIAFENAALDALMKLKEHPGYTFLLGGLDEVSDYNYNIECLAGWFTRKEEINSLELYKASRNGTIAGEGAAMFMVNNRKQDATARVTAVKTLHTTNEEDVVKQLKLFIREHLPAGKNPDLFLTGENGDQRLISYYNRCEAVFDEYTGIARYKHFSGEYPTASSFALWLACRILKNQELPSHFIKKAPLRNTFRHLLVYNCYKKLQHGFMLVERV